MNTSLYHHHIIFAHNRWKLGVSSLTGNKMLNIWLHPAGAVHVLLAVQYEITGPHRQTEK